ncbi:MAG TPA: EAL domain-containing protein [Pyrinomonadaceae bacterium]|jgi:diguanylate cyclase (GGDEF)-like protein/PAS domain S-box-containing protein
MESIGQQNPTRSVVWLVAGFAAGLLALSVYALPVWQLNVPFLLFTLLTISTGSRLSIETARGRAKVSASDSFVFLAMLLFDAEAALFLAALAFLCASFYSHRRGSMRLLSASLPVVSITVTAWVLRFCFGSIVELPRNSHALPLIAAICIMALVQSSFVSLFVPLDESGADASGSLTRATSRSFVWTFVACLAGASAAGFSARLVYLVGYYPSVAIITIFVTAYFIYSPLKQGLKTGEKKAEPELIPTKSEERFRNAFDYAAIGMGLVSVKGRWLQVNHSLCQLLGYTEQELLATDFQAITHPEDRNNAIAYVKRLVSGEIPTHQMEKRYLHKEGHPVWVLWSVSLAHGERRKSAHMIFQVQDITDRKNAEQRLLHDVFHDALTGLPNRVLFMDHLKLAAARAQRREDQIFAVLFLDLDRFKIINDSLGHIVGDQLLVGIAHRLAQHLRPGDTVARIGGDEFTILLEDLASQDEATEIAERIQKELSVSFSINKREVFTTVSIGIALSSTGYANPEDILRDADTAMYRAKSQGKARHVVFDKEMHAHAIDVLQLETDIRRAIGYQEFDIAYQPIVALDDFKLRGFEALVRWRHPLRGLISPANFIPVAEEMGLIIKIDQWVLRKACEQMREWQQRFPSDPPLSISVNLSGKQFAQPDLVEQIKAVLEDTQIDPRGLKLEITESVVMENIETTAALLWKLRELGIRLSIDDFGTGYSSLSYLHRFPIDTLKIDRSFISRMIDNNENREIVRTIVMLAQNLGMDVVAEGVETKAQLEELRKLECQNGQGYLFSKPMVMKAAEKIISDTYAAKAAPAKANENTQGQKRYVVYSKPGKPDSNLTKSLGLFRPTSRSVMLYNPKGSGNGKSKAG